MKRLVISTNGGWVTLRGAPGSFAVALARNGWGFDYWLGKSHHGWLFGGVGGSANGCLWIRAEQVPKSGKTSPRINCQALGADSLRESSYMRVWTGNTCKRRPDGTKSCDGRPAIIDARRCPYGAPVYANVQPWLPNTGKLGEHLYTIPAKKTVRWRYITKDGRYAMMRNPNARPIAQDWGFIPAGCISRSSYGHQEPPRN